MARPRYLSIYADERTQRIFDEFTKEKGVSKSTVLKPRRNPRPSLYLDNFDNPLRRNRRLYD